VTPLVGPPALLGGCYLDHPDAEHCDYYLRPGDCFPVLPDGYPAFPGGCLPALPVGEHCDCCLRPVGSPVLPAGSPAVPHCGCYRRLDDSPEQLAVLERCGCCLLLLLQDDYSLVLPDDLPERLAVLERCDCCLRPGGLPERPADSPAQMAVLEHCDCYPLPAGLPEHPADSGAVPDARLHCWSAEDWRLHGHHAPRA